MHIGGVCGIYVAFWKIRHARKEIRKNLTMHNPLQEIDVSVSVWVHENEIIIVMHNIV